MENRKLIKRIIYPRLMSLENPFTRNSAGEGGALTGICYIGEKMNREKLKQFILDNYNAENDFPWMKYPNYEVFRHINNKKWFALIMDVPKCKLGLQGAGSLDVVNLKCDPILIGTMREEPGFFPAYHMNKESWITIALDGIVPDEKIKLLLDMSYDATA